MKIEIGLRINDEDFGWRKFYTVYETIEEGFSELVKVLKEELKKEQE